MSADGAVDVLGADGAPLPEPPPHAVSASALTSPTARAALRTLAVAHVTGSPQEVAAGRPSRTARSASYQQ
ncbi:hypothetical protein GCM10010521_38790 [Streptomyces rameus]|uniref:Uncharacterized protein n=1 Tax=Streptomyces rameus TaxID=68261 RepID=A0ABP6NH40_9ACTN